MDSFSLYRERIGITLTDRLADAIGNETVTLEEGSVIAKTILDRVQGAKNHTELLDFIEELAHEWPLFGPVLVAEQSSKIEESILEDEKKAVNQVEDLLKENKIDEAAAAAEQATHDSTAQAESIPQFANEQPNTDTSPPSPDLEMQQDQPQPQQTGGTI